MGRQLEIEFGRGFGEKSLRHMIRFAEAFPDWEIVSALLRQLSWTHFLSIIYLKDPLQRDSYAEMCRIEHWSTRTLQERIQSMLFERTALSKKPDALIAQELKSLREQDRLTPDLVFRHPYLLDFLGLKDTYSERDLEAAILRELESFLLELGAGFAFVARQKRINLDGEDFYMDLLFFHRRLRRLVVVELKLGDFKPADLGQIQFYLNWLERHERQPGEEKPLGLILCAGKKPNAWNTSISIATASTWPNTLPNFRPANCFNSACTRRCCTPEHGWSSGCRTKNQRRRKRTRAARNDRRTQAVCGVQRVGAAMAIANPRTLEITQVKNCFSRRR